MTMSSTPERPIVPVTPGAPARRDRLIMGGLLVLVVAGLLGLASATGWDEIGRQVALLGPLQIAVLLALSLVNYGLRGLRWHLLTRRLGLPTSLLTDLRHYLGGFAMTVTPGRVGELVRMRWISRETGWPADRTFPLLIVDRAMDLSAMGLLLALTLAVGSQTITFGAFAAVGALVVAFAATRPQILSGTADLIYRLTGAFARLMARLRRASRSMTHFSGAGVLGIATALGAVGWLAEGWAFYLLLSWLGADISAARAVAIFVFATLAGGLTGAPGGLGGAELAMIALLGLDGIPPEVSVPATAIIRLTTLWFAILIGLMIFPLAERLATRGRTS